MGLARDDLYNWNDHCKPDFSCGICVVAPEDYADSLLRIREIESIELWSELCLKIGVCDGI